MPSLTIKDELTIYTAAEQKTNLLVFLTAGDDLEINFANVTEIDAAGLQLMILIKREAAHLGKNLRFVMHSKAVLDALELVNLTSTFGDQVVLTQN